MNHRLAGTLGVLMLSTPLWSVAAASDHASGSADWSTPLRVADTDADLPLSRDVLFQAEPEADKGGQVQKDVKETVPEAQAVEKGEVNGTPEMPASKADLFGDDVAATGKLGDAGSAKPEAAKAAGQALPLYGSLQTDLTYSYDDPKHWSNVLGRLELGSEGALGQGVRWKMSGRVDYNAVYDLTDFYQSQVRTDQRTNFQVRETYLDFSTGALDWRVGRQHVVWGEMVGLFFADVVSAKDLREFILPDFQTLRIPQWAARAEYFNEDFHSEVVWIPFPSYDLIGTPRDPSKPGSGSDFYPYPPAVAPTIQDEVKPSTGLNHGNFGVRINQLIHGWDLSGFYYSSMNSAPTFYQSAPNVFTPEHDRIWQAGGTLGKDLGSFVLKAEAVYTDGQRFNLLLPVPGSDGVVQQNTLDWAVGLDFNPSADTRVNTQLFQRYYFDHNPDIIPDKTENGASLQVTQTLPDNWKAEALLIHSLNRSDWLFRPKASCQFKPNWKLTFGLDVFGGPPTGLFGQYDQQDRVYSELRYDF